MNEELTSGRKLCEHGEGKRTMSKINKSVGTKKCMNITHNYFFINDMC